MKKYIMVVGASTEASHKISRHLEDDLTEIVYSITSEDAVYQLTMRKFVLVIIEQSYVKPESNDLFRVMKNQSPAPIMIIYTSAKIPDGRRNMGLTPEETAAADFDMNGWAIRVKDYLEQYAPESGNDRSYILARGRDLVIDARARTVCLHGEELELSQKQFDTLHFLASHPGQVLSKSQIFNHLWDEPELEADNSVALHISKLRKKLGDTPATPIFIQTVRGVGYRFAK